MAHFSDLLHQIHAHSGDWIVAEIASETTLTAPRCEHMYFYIVLKGEATLITQAGWVCDLKQSDVSIVFGEAIHRLQVGSGGEEAVLDCFSRSHAAADEPQAMSFGGEQPAANVLIGRIGISWPAVLRPAGLPSCLHLRMGKTRASAREISSTFRRACSGPGASAYLTKLAELAMLRTLRENIDVLSRLPQDTASLQISRALRLIEAEPGKAWSVDRLARAVGMSRSSFADKFVRHMGKSPMEVVADYRMRAAAELLETTRLSVADVASRVGYNSEAALSRRFSQQFGTTPRALPPRRTWQQNRSLATAAARDDRAAQTTVSVTAVLLPLAV